MQKTRTCLDSSSHVLLTLQLPNGDQCRSHVLNCPAHIVQYSQLPTRLFFVYISPYTDTDTQNKLFVFPYPQGKWLFDLQQHNVADIKDFILEAIVSCCWLLDRKLKDVCTVTRNAWLLAHGQHKSISDRRNFFIILFVHPVRISSLKVLRTTFCLVLKNTSSEEKKSWSAKCVRKFCSVGGAHRDSDTPTVCIMLDILQFHLHCAALRTWKVNAILLLNPQI